MLAQLPGPRAPRPSATLARPPRARARAAAHRLCVRAFDEGPAPAAEAPPPGFAELRAAAAAEYERARLELPRLEEARRTAEHAAAPAAAAERRWQEAYAALEQLQGAAQSDLAALRADAAAALGGDAALARAVLASHARARLAAFRDGLAAAGGLAAWRDCGAAPPESLAWLPGAELLTAAAASTVGDRNFVTVCVAVAAPGLDALRSLALHWGVTEGPAGGWLPVVPRGWATAPAVSEPAGKTAWQTPLAAHAPVVAGRRLESLRAWSVVLHIPAEGPLEVRGGVKFVLRRTDGGAPEWVKPAQHSDFFVDLAAPIAAHEAARRAAARAALAAARAVAAEWEAPLAPPGAAAAGAGDGDGYDSDDWECDQPAPAAAPGAGGGAAGWPAAADRGWLARCGGWEPLGDWPPPGGAGAPPRAARLADLQTLLILEAAAGRDGGGASNAEWHAHAEQRGQQAAQLEALLARCTATGEALARSDVLELAAAAAQKEREHFQELHRGAAATAARLEQEVAAALETARCALAACRGRPGAEVTRRDQQLLAHQAARAGGPPGAALVFVAERVLPVAGAPGASVVAHVYLEGPAAAVDAVAADADAGSEGSEAEGGDADAGERRRPARPALDTVVLALAVAQEFPDGASLPAPLAVHWGCVEHAGAKWRPPPPGWSALPPAAEGAAGGLPSVPLRRHLVRAANGAPVLVDPELHAGAVRLPLGAAASQRARGIEFVLKTRDGRYLSAAGGGNFYQDLMLPF